MGTQSELVRYQERDKCVQDYFYKNTCDSSQGIMYVPFHLISAKLGSPHFSTSRFANSELIMHALNVMTLPALACELMLKVLKYGAFSRCENQAEKHQSLWSMLKMIAFLFIMLIINIAKVYIYCIHESQNPDGMGQGLFGLRALEIVAIRIIAYEVLVTWDYLAKLVTKLVCGLLHIEECDAQATNSCYLLFLQVCLIIIFSKFWLNSQLGFQVVAAYIIRAIIQLDTVMNHLSGIWNINDLFQISKQEISCFELDEICVLCQHDIQDGVLLKWNHVLHLDCIKKQYFHDQTCPYWGENIDLTESRSKLQAQLTRLRSNCRPLNKSN